MKKLLLTTALAGLASQAYAGGIERTNQSVAVLFEEGRYAEVSFGYASPSIDGSTSPVPGVSFDSGNMADGFVNIGAAYKADLNDRLSYALIFDQPLGADVDYADAGYPLTGTNAEFNSIALTALLQYNFGNGFSVYGGPKIQRADANIGIKAVNLLNGATILDYSGEADTDVGFGYVVGAAYERPDIALRVALTYGSKIKHSFDTSETIGGLAVVNGTPVQFADSSSDSTDYNAPQYVNLEFQTGIMADTLAFGSIRWVDWTDATIAPPLYKQYRGDLVSYDDDTITYTLGLGRKFTEKLSGAISVSYEDGNGGYITNLGPTDGFTSVAVGGKYKISDAVEVSAGVSYRWVGDATTSLGPNPANPTQTLEGKFDGNNAFGAGVKIGFRF